MTVKYADPWKEEKYGKIKGDKADSFFMMNFSEAIVHKEDSCYYIAGHVTDYQGVVRAYKSEQAMTPGLCMLPIYGSEYEIRKKDASGNYVSEQVQPSVFERVLYESIEGNELTWMPSGQSVALKFTHTPNSMLSAMDAEAIKAHVIEQVKVSAIPKSGTLPEYSPPTKYGQRKGSNWNKGISPEEKVSFLKKQMVADIRDSSFKEEHTLTSITKQILVENADSPQFTEIYFDMLVSCIK